MKGHRKHKKHTKEVEQSGQVAAQVALWNEEHVCALHVREQRADGAKATPHLELDLRSLWAALKARATRNARGLLWFSDRSALCSRIASGGNIWRFVLSCPTKETIAEKKSHGFGRRALLSLRLFLLSRGRNSRKNRNSCIRYALVVFFFLLLLLVLVLVTILPLVFCIGRGRSHSVEHTSGVPMLLCCWLLLLLRRRLHFLRRRNGIHRLDTRSIAWIGECRVGRQKGRRHSMRLANDCGDGQRLLRHTRDTASIRRGC